MTLEQEFRKQLERDGAPFPNACCRDLDNLKYKVELNKQPDIVVLKCNCCGCLHRRQWLESPKINVSM